MIPAQIDGEEKNQDSIGVTQLHRDWGKFLIHQKVSLVATLTIVSLC